MAFPPYTILQQKTGGNSKRHYLDGDGWVDGGAVLVDASILNDGFSANPVVSLWDTAGNKLREQVMDVREVETGAKADSVTVIQSGADLHLTIRYHVGDFNSKVIHTVLAGWLTPYQSGVMPDSKAGAFVPQGEPEPAPGGGGLNEQETITAVKKAVGTDPSAFAADGTLVKALGAGTGAGNDLRQTFRKLGADVFIRFLDDRRDRDPGQQDAPAFRSALFVFFRNALYGLIRKHIFGSWARRGEPGYEVETIDYQQKQIAIIHYAMRHYTEGGALLYQETLQPMGAQASELGAPSQAVEEGEQ